MLIPAGHIQQLRDAGFSAFTAFPGQKAPDITEPVAAVHIHKVDSGSQTVTVEVCILSPSGLGGTACELSGRKAAAALQIAGAVCIQNGCTYDPVAQIYSVSILAVFRGDTGESSHRLGPGFKVYLNNVLHHSVTDFTEEKIQKQTMEYIAGSPEGIMIVPGSYHWNLCLEEHFPAGVQETPEPEEEFQLRILREGSAQIYEPCRWTSVTRSFTAEGLRRICKGIALTRKEDLA